jgi:hypothetical protein
MSSKFHVRCRPTFTECLQMTWTAIQHALPSRMAVIPAKAGIHLALESKAKMDSRFRGKDGGAAARALAVLLQMVDHRANQNITPA